MRLPIKIDPCPIVNAFAEIRFSSPVPPDAVFGIVYNRLKPRYPQSRSLPVLQLPEAIRQADRKLRYDAQYHLEGDDFIVQVGPRVFHVGIKGEHPARAK